MPIMPRSTRVHRRRLLGIAAAAGLLGLAACGTAPPPAAAADEARVLRIKALKSMGFVPNDQGWELSLGVKLLFEPDVDVVSPQGRSALEGVARTLVEVGIDRVRVEGHTDSVGSAKYNQALSLRRAESVAQQLVKAGWKDAAIERIGHGWDKPVADNGSADGRAQNRRVVVTVQVE